MAIDPEQLPLALEEYGNTVSSTIPILLHDLRGQRPLAPGIRSMLVGFGVGLSWAGCMWTETWEAKGAAAQGGKRLGRREARRLTRRKGCPAEVSSRAIRDRLASSVACYSRRLQLQREIAQQFHAALGDQVVVFQADAGPQLRAVQARLGGEDVADFERVVPGGIQVRAPRAGNRPMPCPR